MRRLVPTVIVLGMLSACSRIDYIEIEPKQLTLQRRGETARLRGKAMNRNGNYYARETISWACDNPKALKVDSLGQLTAVGPGHATCTGSAGGKDGTIDIDVVTVETVKLEPAEVKMTEDDEPVNIHIFALDEHGHELKGRTIEMKSKDENVANADGEKVYPVGPGHTQVTIRADDRSAVVDVTVTKGKKKH